MASTPDSAVQQSASRILEIDNFPRKTTLADWTGEYVSFEEGSFKFSIILWPSGFQQEGKQIDPENVYITLHSKEYSDGFWVKLDVSLIDVSGRKQFTQSFGKASRLLEKEGILSRFISRESILDSPYTYLDNDTLKVLFEVWILKEESGNQSISLLNGEKERTRKANAPVSTLAKDYASLLANGSFSDVTLAVGKRQFPAHKAILTERSPVFARMCKESSENRLVIEEIDEQVFTELLNYIYTEQVENLPANARALLIAAKKYQIDSLKDLCCQHLSARKRSTSTSGNYSVCKSTLRILKIDNFKAATSKADWKSETFSFDSTVSLGDASFKNTILLWPSGFLKDGTEIDPNYVYLTLRSNECSPAFRVQLDVSLIDVNGKRRFTQSFGKASGLFEKEDIQSRFCPRASILASPATYLHAGTLKVLFEMALIKEGTSAPLSTLSKNLSSLLEKGSFSDVTLIIGKREFPAHKAILSGRSPVFARMFTSEFRESTENRVVIEEIDEQAFKQLLNYIYTDRIENLPANASTLLIAAETYQIEALRDPCEQYLSTNLTTDNLLSLLQLAYLHNATQLQAKCLAFFEKHSLEIKLTQEWKQLIRVKCPVNHQLLGLLLQTLMDTDYPVKKKVKLSHVSLGII